MKRMRYIDNKALVKKWNAEQAKHNYPKLWTEERLKKDYRDEGIDKCWYSEVDLAGADIHIDHFRPKAKIVKFENYEYNNEVESTGYDWLANDAENYRGACIYSNRKTGKGGKGNYFPLVTGSKHLTPNGNENELPLLLDPCVKDDVNLLCFIDGDVLPTKQDNLTKQRVEATKTIYNLMDDSIKNNRIKVWHDVKSHLDAYDNKKITRDYLIELLKERISRKSPYSACAISCIKVFAPQDVINQLSKELEL